MRHYSNAYLFSLTAMKFQLAINLERMEASQDMSLIASHTLDMVKLADAAGFDIVWAAEHHALEMTIAPNPFQILTWWATHTEHIRLGCAVANAAYWHPIGLAGEAALLDLLSDGRLEFGLGSGAYQREFDRMRPGVKQTDGWRYMQEMLPVVRALWAGDVAHAGEFWQFPSSTSCPKPLQQEVPVWAAARSPVTFAYAVEHNCDVMSWPLTKGFDEAQKYKRQLDQAVLETNPAWRGRFAMMRHAAVYETQAERQAVLAAIRSVLSQFGNLMMQKGEVVNGFPEPVPLEVLEGNAFVDPDMLEENLMFGSAEQVVEKLRRYESLGVDAFIYYASMGLELSEQRRSLELFCERVMPQFADGVVQ
jgi:alkanesulfonate monooxygenase SsuD/methylene tetrahydromethanopterin reductase-like flavin-dependent oxidoreductase (luciferase family)